jgi:hypothetical protein
MIDLEKATSHFNETVARLEKQQREQYRDQARRSAEPVTPARDLADRLRDAQSQWFTFDIGSPRP